MMKQTNLYKVMALFFGDLPSFMSKTRTLLNFFFYAFKSSPSLHERLSSNVNFEKEGKTDSKLWCTFQKYIYLYNVFFNAKYLLRGTVIRCVGGGYADTYFANPEEAVLSPGEINNIPKPALGAIENVVNATTNRFLGVNKEGM